MKPKLYEYEGEMLSAGEVYARVPMYGKSWISNMLAKGAKSRADLDKLKKEAEINLIKARRKAGLNPRSQVMIANRKESLEICRQVQESKTKAYEELMKCTA